MCKSVIKFKYALKKTINFVLVLYAFDKFLRESDLIILMTIIVVTNAQFRTACPQS